MATKSSWNGAKGAGGWTFGDESGQERVWVFPEADAARETVAARGHVNGRGPQAERSGRDERSEVSEWRQPPETVVEAAGHRAG